MAFVRESTINQQLTPFSKHVSRKGTSGRPRHSSSRRLPGGRTPDPPARPQPRPHTWSWTTRSPEPVESWGPPGPAGQWPAGRAQTHRAPALGPSGSRKPNARHLPIRSFRGPAAALARLPAREIPTTPEVEAVLPARVPAAACWARGWLGLACNSVWACGMQCLHVRWACVLFLLVRWEISVLRVFSVISYDHCI